MMPTSNPLFKYALLPTCIALTMFVTGCSDKSANDGTTTQSSNIDPNVLADKQELVVIYFDSHSMNHIQWL